MTTSPPVADPSPDAWKALRSLLSEGTIPPSELNEGVARAAVQGEVELLAIAARPALTPWLEEAIERRQLQAALVSFGELRVLQVLKDASIDRWAALKGSATAHTLYDDPAHRFRRDVDILIDGRDMPALMASAEAAGWQEVTHASKFASAPEGPYEREYTIFIDAGRIECDVHSRVLRWREFPVNVSEILSRARSLETGWRVSAPSDLLVHTALHAANAAFAVPLRSWLDVYRLTTSPELDWDVMVRCATAWRARRCVWAALHVVQMWFGATVPGEVLDALAPQGIRAARLGDALQGQGRWPTTHLATGRLDRASTRLLVRDTAGDAFRYVWQTAARELAMRVSRP